MRKRFVVDAALVAAVAGLVVTTSACDQAEPAAMDGKTSLVQVCDKGSMAGNKRKFFPDAAPVSGPTHPVAVFETGNEVIGRGTNAAYEALKGAGAPPEADPKSIQLAACVQQEKSYNDEQVGSCHYDFPSPREAPVLASQIKVLIWELQTGHQHGELTFDTNNPACPELLTTDVAHAAIVHARPSVDELTAKLTEAIPGAELVSPKHIGN